MVSTKEGFHNVFKIIGAAVIFYIMGSAIAAHFFTMPYHRSIGPPPADFPYPMQNISFQTEDGLTLRGWYSPAADNAAAIILLHGYRSTRRQTLSRAKLFRKHGYGVLLYDARACGESEGERVSVGYYETRDLLAAIRFLRQQGVKEIACLGISQGGATILLAAEKLQGIRCVITESAYSTILTATDNRFRHYTKIPASAGAALMIPFAEYLLGADAGEISPLKSITRLPCPVLIISGTADTRTRVKDTMQLYRAAPHPKALWLVPGADHEDLYAAQPGTYREKVLTFLKTWMPPTPRGNTLPHSLRNPNR